MEINEYLRGWQSGNGSFFLCKKKENSINKLLLKAEILLMFRGGK